MTTASWRFNSFLIAPLLPVSCLAFTAIACSASGDNEPFEPNDQSDTFVPPNPTPGATTTPGTPAAPAAEPTGAQPPLPPAFGPTPGEEPAPPPENAPPPPPSDLGAGEPTAPPPPSIPGQVAGAEFFERIAGTWTGINSNTPIGFDFPLTVSFAPDDSLMFGKFEIDAQNSVLWGFNVENYGKGDVLAYRNGGYLLGLRRDSRTALVEYDTDRGYYRFCAVKESGFPVDGCNYIDARYTFTAPDRMLFEVFTRGTDPHVHWEAVRVEAPAVQAPFPASLASQGDGSAAWPASAGMD